MSDAIPIPPRPDLAQYKKQAKELLKTSRSADAAAIRAWTSRFGNDAQWIQRDLQLRRIEKLSDAQLFLARAHGFESWPKFAKHIESLQNAASPDATFEAAADAIVSGDIATLERILKKDPALIRRRSSRRERSTLLHYVSANGIEDFRQKTPRNIVDITRLLLDAGADVNAESDAYRGHATTLGLVATSIHPEEAGVQIPLMDLLLERGAVIERSVVRDCLANGRGAAAEFLAARGAQLDLEGAAGVGRLDLVQSLLPNASRQEIDAGFLWACEFGRNDIVELLLDRGVDPGVGARIGMTGLHLAAHGGHLDTVELLLSRNAPLEATNVYGGTVLGGALWSAINHPRPDHPKIIETLIDAGAKIGDDWFTGNSQIDALLRRDGRIAELKRRAQSERGRGNGEAARQLYEEAVALCRQRDDRLLLAHTLRHLADVNQELGRDEAAGPQYDEVLALYRGEQSPPLDLANAIRGAAVFKEATGEAGEAEQLWEEAHKLYIATNVPPGAAETAARLALHAHRRGDGARSDEWLRIAEAAARASGDSETQRRVREMGDRIRLQRR
jgi:tetratricopeptide (TPR) repeat protein